MQVKKCKLVFYLLVILGVAGLFPTFEVCADVSEVSIDLLLKNQTGVDSVKQEVLKIDDNATFEEIPEIQLLRIKSSFEAVEEVKKNDNIELSGKLADMFVEDKRLIHQKSLLKKTLLSETIDSEEVMDEFALLDQLAWYKETMLGNRKVLEKSAGQGIQIGLIDSGIDTLHPLLSPVVDLTKAKSFVANTSSIVDENGHGTMVAGIMAQLAPQAKITPYRVLSADGGESFWTLEAMIQAVNDGQDILNMSLGTYKYGTIEDEKITIESFERSVDYALKNNVIVISSSGNKGLDLDLEFEDKALRHLPGSVPGVLSISALTFDDKLASYSNFGNNVQHAAPGGDYAFIDGMLDVSQMMYTAYPTTLDNMLGEVGVPQGYMFSAGTSLSAPCISGIIANQIAYYQKMTGNSPNVDQIKKDLAASSLDLGIQGKNKFYGYGLPKIEDLYNLVPDTVPPSGSFKEQIVEINEIKEATDFVEAVADNSGSEVMVSYLNKPDFAILGKQEIQIKLEDASANQTVLVGMITINDTQAPTGQFIEQVVEVNEPNRAEEYVKDLQDNSTDKVSVSYVIEPNFSSLGEQEVVVQLEDSSGNKTRLAGSVMIKDTQAPAAMFKNIKVVQGEKLQPEMFLEQIKDNYDSTKVTATFVKPVSTEQIGKQKIEIRLSDPSGNSVILTGDLEVVKATVKAQNADVAKQISSLKNNPEKEQTTVTPSARKTIRSEKNLPNTSEKVAGFPFIGYWILGGTLYTIRQRYGSKKQ